MSCNGSGLRETLLKDRTYESEDAASSARRKADVEKWAALLAAGATQAYRSASVLGPVPEGWRSDVEEMTPANTETQRSSNSSAIQQAGEPRPAAQAADTDTDRLQVRVNIEEMGELALVVERSPQGMRVQISAQDHRILELMAIEQNALTAALSGIGEPIASLSFVPMHSVGTKLAQPRGTSQASRFQRDDSASTQQTARGKRKSRGLNVIG